MPGYVIHLAIGKRYIEKKKIKNKEEFLKGVIMPDLLDKKVSHYGDSSGNPDFQNFLEQNSLEDNYNQGYFLHLITDYLFYNKYLESFSDDIYHDYNKLNEILIKKYNVEIPEIIKLEIEFENGEPNILKKDSICRFIEAISEIDIDEIKHTKDSENIYETKTKEETEK